MNKPIIIDGVDVSGCVRLAIDNISCNLGGECKGWGNCYYKQLQRLKAENERLKKEVSDLNFYIDSYRQVWEIDKYKQTLEDIKEIAEKEGIIFNNKRLFPTNIEKIIDKINEVLKDE